MLRDLEPDVNWEEFCERQRERGMLDLNINVLAVFFDLWGCAAELPRAVASLKGALAPREAARWRRSPRPDARAGSAENRA